MREKITDNFYRDEFACKCGCGLDTIDEGLVRALQSLRDHFNTSVVVTSGLRCAKHNKAIGGAPKSKHMEGIAADFVVKGVTPDEVYKYLTETYPDKYGIGNYSGWNHFDIREDGVWRKAK